MQDQELQTHVPQLTLTHAEQLLGDRAKNMVIYTFDNNIEGINHGWNRTEYNGCRIADLGEATIHANKIQKRIQAATHNPVKMFAIKTVDHHDFHTNWPFTENPRYGVTGFVMANFIAYDPKTGKYHANKNGWYATDAYPCARDAATRGVVDTMFYLATRASELNKMISDYYRHLEMVAVHRNQKKR